jgi:hypothetical protein
MYVSEVRGFGIWIDPRRLTPTPKGLPGFLAPYHPPFVVEYIGPTTGGVWKTQGPFSTWMAAEQYALREGQLQAGQGDYRIFDRMGREVDMSGRMGI